jgi:pimeloyl-ACP methyl ester carboxylesterase
MGLCVVLLLASCAVTPPEPPKLDRAALASSRRPLQAVPDVRPAGFSEPPPGTGLARYTSQRLAWQPCEHNLQCAAVLVPLDYSTPDQTAISLALTKKPATGNRRLGSLFINPGGPGGSGRAFVTYFPSKGLPDYDIIGWDPRGVGASTPVICAGADLDQYLSMDASPDNDGELATLIEANRTFGRSCLASSGVLLQHVSTVEVARDLDLLRALVGDDKLNFYGASYGTDIGATYAQLFGTRVGRMVLDGAVDITGKSSTSQAQGFDRALGAFARWCAGRECELGTTQEAVEHSIAAFWATLDSHPMRVGRRQLTQQLGVAGVLTVLYENADGYPILLKALTQALVYRDGRILLALADRQNQRDQNGGYGQINEAFPAVECLDTKDRGLQGEIDKEARTDQKAPIFGPVLGPNLLCPMWPVAARPGPKIVAAQAPPIVVIGTTGDPATPYEDAVAMSKQLKSGVLVTFHGVGHTAYDQSACVHDLVVRDFEQGVLPRPGTSC